MALDTANLDEPKAARFWLGSVAVAAPASRRVQIVDALREAIVRNEIPSGTQLKQEDLAALFGASPAPVREALRQLVSEGLVEHHPNRGSFVSSMSTDELLSVVLPVRVLAEVFAATRIAGRVPPDLRAKLEAEIVEMDHGAADEDLGRVIEADVRFHRTVMESCGSYQVMQLWQSVLSRIRVQLYRLGPRHGSLAEVPEEHRSLLAVLEDANLDAVKREFDSHIVEASAALLEP